MHDDADLYLQEIILHTLFESGVSKVQELERYVTDDIERNGVRLVELEKKLVNAYRDAVRFAFSQSWFGAHSLTLQTAGDILEEEGLFEEEDEEEAGALTLYVPHSTHVSEVTNILSFLQQRRLRRRSGRGLPRPSRTRNRTRVWPQHTLHPQGPPSEKEGTETRCCKAHREASGLSTTSSRTSVYFRKAARYHWLAAPVLREAVRAQSEDAPSTTPTADVSPSANTYTYWADAYYAFCAHASSASASTRCSNDKPAWAQSAWTEAPTPTCPRSYDNTLPSEPIPHPCSYHECYGLAADARNFRQAAFSTTDSHTYSSCSHQPYRVTTKSHTDLVPHPDADSSTTPRYPSRPRAPRRPDTVRPGKDGPHRPDCETERGGRDDQEEEWRGRWCWGVFIPYFVVC